MFSVVRSALHSSASSTLGFFGQHLARAIHHLPHTDAYLTAQLQALRERNMPATLTTLKKGQCLYGLDVNVEAPFDGVPLCNTEALSKLSQRERQSMQEMGEKYYARIAKYTILQDIRCVQGYTDAGCPIYYVHHLKTAMNTPISVERLIDDETSHTAAPSF